MLYLTNALVPPAGHEGTMIVARLGPLTEPLLDLIKAVAPRACSAIGHPSTAALLGVEPSRAMIEPAEGSVAIVVRLATRPTVSGVEVASPAGELEALLVGYTGPCIHAGGVLMPRVGSLPIGKAAEFLAALAAGGAPTLHCEC